jgi:valyl-tRNA synthetase
MRINKPGYDTWLDIDTGMARSYIDKLIDQKATRSGSIDRLETRLSNPKYADKAPAAIVEQTRQQLEQEKALLAQVQSEIDTFSKLIES